MKLFALILATFTSLAASVRPAAADDTKRLTAATTWIDAMVLGQGTAPAPSADHPIKVVFDGKAVFAADSTCAKLRVATLTTADQLAELATCLQTALHEQALEDPKFHAEKVATAPVRWIKGIIARPLHKRLVVPRGTRLLGKTFNRSINDEGAGVAVMVSVLVDAGGRVIAVYAFAGGWAYPV